MAMTSTKGFPELIHPVTPETFAGDYWEQRPLILQRDDPGYYADLLTLADLDGILASMSVPESSVRLANRGTTTWLPDLAQIEDGWATEAVYREYRQGATINIVHLHEHWPALGRLCRALTSEFTATVQTNIYLTPRRSQGLTPHYDNHDVFVAQIHGTKHWCLYDSPVRLPLAEQRSGPASEHGAPLREFDMKPGDLLYLPRGTVHDATSNDEASLHLTIGVAPLTWAGYLQIVLRDAATRDVRLREGIPRHPNRLRETVGSLLNDISGHIDAGALLNDAHRALAGGAAELSGHLLDLEVVPALDLDTSLSPRAGLADSLSVTGDTVCLEFQRKQIRMPARVADEMRFVTTRAGFTGREIPGPLDEPGRLVLLRTLLREGALTRASAPAPAIQQAHATPQALEPALAEESAGAMNSGGAA
jgi:ribosomal protein L16 Arg81 hydroxylase